MIYAEAHKGTTLFVTTHYMDEAEYCDRVSIMVEVILRLDTPKNLVPSGLYERRVSKTGP
jgi:ABC-2 type transport system ATP-binding protein